MTEPKRESHNVPSSHKENYAPEKINKPPLLKSGPEIPKTENEEQKTKTIERIKRYLSNEWVLFMKFPPISYFIEFHKKERGGFWLAIFTVFLVIFTRQLVVVNDKV